MKELLFLAFLMVVHSQAQGNTYPCLEISGVGCVCGQGYRNVNGICTLEISGTQCITGFVWNGTACAAPVTPEPCPTGQIRNGAICVPDPVLANNNPACQPNELFIAGRCIPPSGNGNCAAGSIWNGTNCVSPTGNNLNSNGLFPSSGQTTGSTAQMVCQSGYYFNCQTCVPYTGVPLCQNSCTFNGTTCVARSAGLLSNFPVNGLQSLGSATGNQQSNTQGGRNLQQTIGGGSSFGNSNNNREMCPSGYRFDGNTCAALSSNTNLVPRDFYPTGSAEYASVQDIICPQNYCYNGQRCIPNEGNNNLNNNRNPTSQVNCSSGFNSGNNLNGFNFGSLGGTSGNNQNSFQQFPIPSNNNNNNFFPTSSQNQQSNFNSFPSSNQQSNFFNGQSFGSPFQSNNLQGSISCRLISANTCSAGCYWDGAKCVSA